MDFALLPPEINSGRMYAGPGSGPMLAAAAGWDGLAADLEFAAASYQSTISSLTSGPWLGPSSASMAAAAAAYVSWISSTAIQAWQAATQAKMAAGAYEAAFAMTVPPPVIAANRSLLMALVATNFLGQNTPAIAATEAQYAEMWAQDATAMYAYAGASAAATTLTPFTPPPPTTNPAGLAGQAAAVAQAAGTSAGTSTQTIMSTVPQLISAVPSALQGLLSPLQGTSTTPLSLLSSIGTLTLTPTNSGLSGSSVGLAGSAASNSADLRQDTAAFGSDLAMARSNLDILMRLVRGVAIQGVGAGAAPAVSASMGQAASIGTLSVPQGWAAAAPAIRPVAVALPATNLSVAPAVLTGASGNLLSEMALASMAGRAMGDAVSPGRRERVGATTRERATPPQRSLGEGPIAGIAAGLRELADLHDSGILTDEEFTEQKRRLLGH